MEYVPRFEIFETHELLSRAAADYMAALLKEKPDAVLCLATGNTPTRAYELLAERFRGGEFKTDKLTVVKLDEWGGLAMDDPGSCETYLQQNVIAPLGIKPEHYISFESNPVNPQKEAERIQKLIAPLTFDLVLLGLGINGHIGFNEPHEIHGAVHVAHLQEITLQHSMLRDARDVRYGLTIGFDDILRSRMIVMLVSGASKREQLRIMLDENISPAYPATYLRKSAVLHIMTDRAASQGLSS